MKPATLVPLAAAAATAFIVPDAQVLAQLPIVRNGREQPLPQQPHDAAEASWRDWLPSADTLSATAHDLFDTLTTDMHDAVHDVQDKLPSAADLVSAFGAADLGLARPPRHGEPPHLTIYQVIDQSKHYFTRLAKLVNEYDDIVQVLNSTAANYTLFAPIDAAFEHLPEGKKPSKEFVKDVLKYHVGVGLYPAKRVLVTHTLPSALEEPLLGDKPQRLRTSVGLLSGVRVNFYSKVVAIDIGATNGVIHAVKSLLVPPPVAGRELALFPSSFSTLLLAFDKTNFTQYVHGIKMTGATVFAPDNAAFAKLGPAANAFLFNSPKGLKYLTAILKYHIVPDQVVYSDAYYSAKKKDAEDVFEGGGNVGRGHYHLDVPTLLDEKSIAIDVARFAGLISVKLNGYIPIKVQDIIAKNGVTHIPSSVLIPPHHDGGKSSAAVDDEISVEELVERLSGYVDEPATGGKDAVENEL